MKIAIPVDQMDLSSQICPSLGRSPYFIIYDLENGIGEFISNHAASSQGGAGIKTAQMIADQKVDALITLRCGENAAEVINTAGIKIYKALNGSVEQIIETFKNNQLSLLTSFHAGFHGHME